MEKTNQFESEIRGQMCDIGRKIWQKGFCAGNEGNHSYRLSPDRILCTPSMISKGNLKPEDLCIVDMDGVQVSGSRKRTSEILLHLTIYKERNDVKAIIHGHPPHVTAFAVAGIDLPTCVHPEAEIFLGPVKTARYVTPGDSRLGESIQPFIAESNTILLGNHGVVCYGPDLEDAYYKLEIVDAYARILILARQLGSVQLIGPTEMRELMELKKRFGLSDPRMTTRTGVENTPSAGTDFFSRMRSGNGSNVAVSEVNELSTLKQAVAALVPKNYSDQQIDQLVKNIADQLLALCA